MQIESFPFIADKLAKVLILGTMPGRDSLNSKQYYNHPNNLFWDIIFRVCNPKWKCDEVVSTDYKTKTELLIINNIALWDVLKFCDRDRSSLDKHIRNQIHNDFVSFFKEFENISTIFFNGKEAAKFFEDFREEALISKNREFIILQSTSPSNKTNSFRILKEWFQIRNYII